jgi:hypothetical protein
MYKRKFSSEQEKQSNSEDTSQPLKKKLCVVVNKNKACKQYKYNLRPNFAALAKKYASFRE